MSNLRRAIRVGAVLSGMLLSSAVARAEEIVWWTPNWSAARAAELVKQFEAKNPDITVRMEQTVSDGLQNRVQVVLRAGTPPDLIDIDSSWNPAFSATGLLLDLDDYVAKSGFDMSDLLPVSVAISKYDGKLYGMPYRAATQALIYNKDLFRAAGLDPDKPPETWQELLADAKQLTRKAPDGRQQYGYGLNGGGEVANLTVRLLPFIWSNGGDVVSADGKQALINQPKAVEAVAFYTNLFTTEGVAPPSTLQNDGAALRRLFDNGVIAMYQSGQYDLPAIRQEAPNVHFGVGLLPHPEGAKPVGVLGGWTFVMPAAAKHHDATWHFVMFLMQPEPMGFYTDTFPTRKSAMGLPRFQDPDLEKFKAMLDYMRPTPSLASWIRVAQIMYDGTQRVLTRTATPQAAMDAAAKQMQPTLER